MSWLSRVLVRLYEFVTVWSSLRGAVTVLVWVLVSERGWVAVRVAEPLPAEVFTAVLPDPLLPTEAPPSLWLSSPGVTSNAVKRGLILAKRPEIGVFIAVAG